LGITALVDITGTVPHKVALQHIVSADLLLLVPGIGESTMTGKIFEYIAAKRPIFVVGNDCAAANFVTRLGIGCVTPTDDIDKIAESLVNMMKLIETESYCYPDVSEVLKNYERKGIARAISELIYTAINDYKNRKK
jgi:hypothetical protein